MRIPSLIFDSFADHCPASQHRWPSSSARHRLLTRYAYENETPKLAHRDRCRNPGLVLGFAIRRHGRAHQMPVFAGISRQNKNWRKNIGVLAGAGGLEPPYGGIKIRSTSSRLTSSRRQIVGLHGGGPVRGLLLTDERARRARAVSNQFSANMTRKICRTKCRINLKISTARIS